MRGERASLELRGLDMRLVTIVTLFAAAGTLGGAAISYRTSPANLRKVLAVFVVVVALFLVAKNYAAPLS